MAMIPSPGEEMQLEPLNNKIDSEVKLSVLFFSFFLRGTLSSVQTCSKAICFAKRPIDKNPFTPLCIGNKQR